MVNLCATSHNFRLRHKLNLCFSHAYHRPATYRPRLLLSGEAGQGQTSHLAPAVLHHLEGLPVHILDLPALFSVSAVAPEEACAKVLLLILIFSSIPNFLVQNSYCQLYYCLTSSICQQNTIVKCYRCSVRQSARVLV